MKLVISGGGIKTVGALGALEVALSHIRFNQVVGTSAGSIVAVLYCLGYSPERMLELLNLTKLPEIDTISMANFINHYGLLSSDDLWNTFEDMFEICDVPLNLTLLELFGQSQIVLEITGFNLETQKTIFFSHLNFPDMRVIQAIAISCNIPLLFEPIEYQGQTYVDGGVKDNYPLTRFAYNDPEVIGIRVYTPTQPFVLEDVASFVSTIFQSVFQGSDNCQQKFNMNQSIDIEISNVSPVDFQLDQSNIQDLYQKGKKTALEYFQTNFQTNYVSSEKTAKINFYSVS